MQQNQCLTKNKKIKYKKKMLIQEHGFKLLGRHPLVICVHRFHL